MLLSGPLNKQIANQLSKLVDAAKQEYADCNPKSLAANYHARHFIPGDSTRSSLHSSPFPLVLASGKGTTLTFLDGDTYVDFLGEYSIGIYGYDHPVI